MTLTFACFIHFRCCSIEDWRLFRSRNEWEKRSSKRCTLCDKSSDWRGNSPRGWHCSIKVRSQSSTSVLMISSSFHQIWSTYITNLFHRCLSVLEDLPTANDDQKKGISIVQFALKQPTMKIAENAGAGTYLLDRQFIINSALFTFIPSIYYP